MSVQVLAESIRSKIGVGDDLGASVKFDCGDQGVVVIDGSFVSIEDKPTDCTIKCDIEVLRALISGDLNATSAFMQGKLKIEGDMSIAMRLSQVL